MRCWTPHRASGWSPGPGSSWFGRTPQVIWATERKDPRWNRFDAKYHRSSTGGGRWEIRSLPESWLLHYKDDLTFHVKPMNFKHTGVFPEQAANWDYIREKVEGPAGLFGC